MLLQLNDPSGRGEFDGYDDNVVNVIDGDRASNLERAKIVRWDREGTIGDKVGLILFQLLMMALGIYAALVVDEMAWNSAGHWVAAGIAYAVIIGLGYLIWRNTRIIYAEFKIRNVDVSHLRFLYWDDPVMERLRKGIGDDWPHVRHEMLQRTTLGMAYSLVVDDYADEFYGVLSHKANGFAMGPDAKAIAGRALHDAVGETVAAIRSLSKTRYRRQLVRGAQTELHDQVGAAQASADFVAKQNLGLQLAESLVANRSHVETT